MEQLLPEDFATLVKAQVGIEAEALFESLRQTPPTAILKNRVKFPQKVLLYDGAEQVPWCPDGIYLDKRPRFTLDPLFHAGVYYVMEASSMVVSYICSMISNGATNIKVLDLCAAPGGKSMVLRNVLSDDSLLLANEVNSKRYGLLRENIIKWGHPSTATSNCDPSELLLDGYFDVVLTDAPCSGEGLFRKDPGAMAQWSLAHVRHCSARQRRILAESSRLTRTGGHIIYSTCTFNALENIENVDWLCKNFSFEPVSVPLEQFGFVRVSGGKASGYQAFPHRVEGEGLFTAVLRKTGESTNSRSLPAVKKMRRPRIKPLAEELAAVSDFLSEDKSVDMYSQICGRDRFLVAEPQSLRDSLAFLSERIPRFDSGVKLGVAKRNGLVPDHQLAMSPYVSTHIQRCELNRMQALAYLSKGRVESCQEQKGWMVVTHNDICLGWVKSDGRRVNNYYPTQWRIRMDIADPADI